MSVASILGRMNAASMACNPPRIRIVGSLVEPSYDVLNPCLYNLLLPEGCVTQIALELCDEMTEDQDERANLNREITVKSKRVVVGHPAIISIRLLY